jgi:vancomycin resistance protein YoaR
MPTSKTAPAKDSELELEDFQTGLAEEESEENAWQRAPLWARILGASFVILVVLTASFEFVYASKVYPGVTANGVYVGGMSRQEAAKRLADRETSFTGGVVSISHKDTHLRIPVASLGVSYDAAKAVDKAMAYGRSGSLGDKIRDQARALVGRPTAVTEYAYPDHVLIPYLVELSNDLEVPVINAKLSFDDSTAQVTPAAPGRRLDLGRLTQLVNDRLATMSSDDIAAPVYELKPTLGTEQLKAAVGQIGNYIAGPITVTYQGTERVIDQATIISWIEVAAEPQRDFLVSHRIEDMFDLPPIATLGLSRTQVAGFVADLAGGIDQDAQNAEVSMIDGKLSVTQPSRAGVKVDQNNAIERITESLSKSGDQRRVSLRLTTTTAEVNETNLEDLGIKELLSVGETMFPGSSAARMTNIRQGAKRYNNVLLKPGETFSFGKLLGAVGPETGYLPELVILANREEKQYGGGLCQVASTAYRAALLAGLPITERHNHSFAVSYYTAPYGAPGVDATIYYPQVDFKFVNDTPGYILIQTKMEGSNLKFYYYGTKTKSGVIRGPEFLEGTNDATKPSRTVFWRDILDVNGKVVKTDTVYTRYKSSLDFPISPEIH